MILRKLPLATQISKAEDADEKPWTGSTLTVTQQQSAGNHAQLSEDS